MLSDRVISWMITILFALGVLNIVADAIPGSTYQSNGGVNFAFSALITALATEKFVAVRSSSRKNGNGNDS